MSGFGLSSVSGCVSSVDWIVEDVTMGVGVALLFHQYRSRGISIVDHYKWINRFEYTETFIINPFCRLPIFSYRGPMD